MATPPSPSAVCSLIACWVTWLMYFEPTESPARSCTIPTIWPRACGNLPNAELTAPSKDFIEVPETAAVAASVPISCCRLAAVATAAVIPATSVALMIFSPRLDILNRLSTCTPSTLTPEASAAVEACAACIWAW